LTISLLATPADPFAKNPPGRYTATTSAIIWCASRTLCGLHAWGHPTGDELIELARIADHYTESLDPQFDLIVDGRQVEGLDSEALMVLTSWVLRHGPSLLTRARFWSVVGERGVAARLAGLFPMNAASGATNATNKGPGRSLIVLTDATEAFTAVLGAELGRETEHAVERAAAEARGVPRELQVVRALLAQRVDTRIDEAARAVGLSPRSLQRWLSEHGTSFHEEVITARFATACSLLLTTDWKLAAIAGRLGVSERAVTMLFRAKTGLSPAAWRAAQRS
jgi:AraC-like DNA-binding protein